MAAYEHFERTMANLRRGSDCSDYNTAHQNARRNALQRIQQKQNSIQDQLQRHSLTASDSELNTIDEPASPRQDENRGSQADLVDDGPQEVGRVSGWAVSFERLLKDELGLAYFTDFLKQEFSEENILFWISCEQLSKVTDGTKLKEKAETIYRRFLSSYATMPVNLEGNYRQMVESAMKNPTPEMYKDQQSQIFKLMKLDSYSRFLKSKLYQDCVLSEMGNLPLPAIESQSITDLGDLSERGPSGARTPTPTPSDSDTLEKKPKKKADKTGKNKVQGRDGDVPESLDRQTSDEKKQRSLLPWFKGFTGKRVGTTRSNNEKETQFYVTSPTPHIPISHSETELSRPGYSDSVPRHQRSLSQFSATFPNNVILTIKVIPDKTIGEVLLPLCEEHGLTQQTAEIFLKTSKGGLIVREKLIDLTQDVSALGGREIVVERRVVFKIELPCKRLIGVKSKPTKKLIEVLRPVTYKYDLQLDRLVVHLNNSPIPLDLEITVATLDNQRIMVETFEQYSAADIRSKGNLQNERPRRSSSPVRKTSDQSSNGKSANDKQQPASTNGPSTMQQNNNNHSGNMRLTEVDDATDLYRLVAKANRRRLDDQRGLTLRNLEVPDFLLNRGDPPTRPQTSLGVAERGGVQRAQEVDLRPTSTPPRQAPPPGCDFETGTIPTHKQAAELFGGADGNISFSGSLNSSGYPDSMPDTGHTGEGMTPEQYRIPDEGYTPTNDRSNYHPKVSGISIMSEVDIPMSPLYESQNGADHSPGFDPDSTLTAPGRENYSDVQATPTPSHDATALGGVPDIAAHNGGERLSTLPRRNNNYMKTLYEESSSQDRNSSSNNSAKPRVARKPPMVAPKPQARRTTSTPVGVKLPTAKKVITVIGADGKQHRATFV